MRGISPLLANCAYCRHPTTSALSLSCSHNPMSAPVASAANAAAAAASSSTAAAEIARALAGVRESISALVQQHGIKKQPLLVAVSKTKPSEAVLHAYAAGQRHFGENYVQELCDKAALPALSPSATPGLLWHFIGHLQTNKAKHLARIPNLACVESVDSVRLATALDKACKSVARPAPLPVLIQVNTSGEASKFGCAPSDAVALFGHVLRECPALQPRGLMTIGRLADTPQPDCFDLLVKLKADICDKFGAATAAATAAAEASDASARTRTIDPASFELSMGMSGDYACALERGATELRIGSTIFGARVYPNAVPPPTEQEEAQAAAAEEDGQTPPRSRSSSAEQSQSGQPKQQQ